MTRTRRTVFFSVVTVLITMLAWMNLRLGSVDITAPQVLAILRGAVSEPVPTRIILNIRLPRMISAILLGGALALSGYLLQTFFSNPIVGPFVLGISSGAKLAVALAMILCLSAGRAISLTAMVGAAFAGALAAVSFVLLISFRVKNISILVVCGIMIGYICSAITDFAVTFADDSNIVNLHNWSMGSLSGINWDEIGIMSVMVGLCLLISGLMVKPMGAYLLGEAYARSAGANVLMLRVLLILVSSFLTACVTAFAGPISFVGIAVPHLVRSGLKTNAPFVMIPGCFMGGAVITLLCDAIARTVFAPTEVSISSVTALFLVPVVVFMMIRRNDRNRDQ